MSKLSRRNNKKELRKSEKRDDFTYESNFFSEKYLFIA